MYSSCAKSKFADCRWSSGGHDLSSGNDNSFSSSDFLHLLPQSDLPQGTTTLLTSPHFTPFNSPQLIPASPQITSTWTDFFCSPDISSTGPDSSVFEFSYASQEQPTGLSPADAHVWNNPGAWTYGSSYEQEFRREPAFLSSDFSTNDLSPTWTSPQDDRLVCTNNDLVGPTVPLNGSHVYDDTSRQSHGAWTDASPTSNYDVSCLVDRPSCCFASCSNSNSSWSSGYLSSSARDDYDACSRLALFVDEPSTATPAYRDVTPSSQSSFNLSSPFSLAVQPHARQQTGSDALHPSLQFISTPSNQSAVLRQDLFKCSGNNRTTLTPTSSVSQGCSLFNQEIVDEMTRWFEANIDHPYPEYSDYKRWAAGGKITVGQAQKWFANKRLRTGTAKTIRRIVLGRRERRAKAAAAAAAAAADVAAQGLDVNMVMATAAAAVGRKSFRCKASERLRSRKL